MRILATVQRILMWLLVIPVAAIALDVLLRALGAQRANPIVGAVRRTAGVFILDPFTDVFPKQSYVETGVVALVGYGLIALLIVGVFRLIRSIIAARPPARPAPATPARSQKSQQADAQTEPVQPTGGTTGSGSDTAS